MAYSTPSPSTGGPLQVNSSIFTFNGVATGSTYLPVVTWKDTINNSANNNTASEQQLSVAAQNRPIPIVYGQARIGPKIAYVTSVSGTLYVLDVWCHGPVDSIVTKWADDKTFPGNISAEDKLGDSTQTASTTLSAIVAGYGASTTFTGVVITSTTGKFTYTNTATCVVGQTVTISGTLGGTGTISGYSTPKTYFIIDTNGTSDFTLSATYNGVALTTTPGTPTGLTYIGAKDRLISPPVCYSVFSITPSTSTSGQTTFGFPRINYLIKGIKPYDPRAEATRPLASPSTWIWSANPALCLADFLSNTIYGCGYTVDWASVAVVADFNDTTSRTLNLCMENPQQSEAWIDTLRTYADCWVVISNGVAKLIPDRAGNQVASYYHSAGTILGIQNINKRGVMDVPNYLTVEYTDTAVVPYRTAPAIIDVSQGATLKESSIQLPGINNYAQAYREGIERLNKLRLNDLSFDLAIFDEGLKVELGDIVGVVHPIGIGSSVTNLVPYSEVQSTAAGAWVPANLDNTVLTLNNTANIRDTTATSAARLVESVTTTSHSILAPRATITPGVTYTSTIEVKPYSTPRKWVAFQPDNGNANLGPAQWYQIASDTLSSFVITGTAGQCTCAATSLWIGQTVVISGTFGGTGTISGYSNPTTYRVGAAAGGTAFTLTTTAGGALTTTAGTPTGITITSPVQVGDLAIGLTSASITALASGWYRLTSIASAKPVGLGGTRTADPKLYLSTGQNVLSYLGVSNTGIWFSGIQIEASPAFTTYSPNVTTAGTTNYPKLMRTMGIDNTGAGRYTLKLVEYDPAVYSVGVATQPTYGDSNAADPYAAMATLGAITATEQFFLGKDGNLNSRFSISWTPISDPFILKYNVKITRTDDNTGTANPLVVCDDEITTSPYVFGPLDHKPSLYYYKIEVKAIRNGYNVYSNTSTVLQAEQGKTTPPTFVGTPALSITPTGLLITWSSALDTDLNGYKIYDGSTVIQTLGIQNSTIVPFSLATVGAHTFGVSAFDSSGNECTKVTITPTTVTASPAVANFASVKNDVLHTLSWDTPSSLFWSIDYYDVRYDGTAFNNATVVSKVYANTLTRPIDWYGTRTWRIKPVDIAGNAGTETTVAHTITSVATITTFTKNINGDFMTLSWAPPTISANSIPLRQYEITKAGSSVGVIAATNAQAVSQDFYIDWTGTKVWTVAAYDKIDTNPGTAASLTVTVSPIPAIAPSAVVLGDSAYITWSAPTTGNTGTLTGTLPVTKYEIRKGGTAWSNATTVDITQALTSTVLINTPGDQTYRVAAYDRQQIGDTTGTPFTLSIAMPNGVSSLTATVVDNNVSLKWTKPTIPATGLPIAAYEIRKGSSWASGTSLGRVGTSAEFKSILESVGGTFTYWVKAIDTAENYTLDANVASVTAVVSQPPDYILNTAWTSLFSPDAGIYTANPLSGFVITGIAGQCTWSSATVANGQAMKISGTFGGTGSITGYTNPKVYYLFSTSATGGVLSSTPVTSTPVVSTAGTPTGITCSPSAIILSTSTNVSRDTDGSNLIGVDTAETWTNHFDNFRVSAVTVNSGGTGYAIGDIVELVSGAGLEKARCTVATTGSPGVVATLTVIHPGSYTAAATASGTTTTITGVGTGLTTNTPTSAKWSTPQAQINAGFPIYIQPGMPSGSYEETYNYGSSLTSTKVTVTTTGLAAGGNPTVSVDLAVSPDNSTWRTYTGQNSVLESIFQYVKYKVNVINGIYDISQLSLTLDAKIRNDGGMTSVAITTGTIVNFNTTFTDVSSITLSAGGTTFANMTYNFFDSVVTGTYTWASNLMTVTATGHSLIAGQKVKLAITSGQGVSGVYTIVTRLDANTYTVALTGSGTGGNVSTYPQSFIAYAFDAAGASINLTNASWSVKGY